MSPTQLRRLAAILGGLLVLWAVAALARRRETTSVGRAALQLPPVSRAAVDTIVLTRPGDTAVMARRDTSTWTVNGYPTSPQEVADLFTVLGDSAPESELVAEQRASQAGLGVDSVSGTRVQIKGKGRTLADFVVGHRSPDFSGGYLRLANQTQTYQVRGRLVQILSLKTDEWRDHRIAAVPADSVAAVEVTRGARRYALRRNGGLWTLGSGHSADSARVADFLAAYRSVNATGFASRAQADSAHFTTPDRRVRLLRKGGTPLLTLVFDSTSSGFWIRPDTSKIIYQVDKWTADRLAPADTAVRAKKK